MLLDVLDASLPANIRKAVARLVKTALCLSEQDLRSHKGIHLHRIQHQFDPTTGLALESMEVTRSARMKCMVEAGKLVLLSLHTDHLETYGSH